MSIQKKKENGFSASVVRKATPEEIAKYNAMLNKESARMERYHQIGVSLRVNLEGNYSTTAKA